VLSPHTLWYRRRALLGATRAGRAPALAHGPGVRGPFVARTAPTRAERPESDGHGRVSLRWLDGRRVRRRRVPGLAMPGGNRAGRVAAALRRPAIGAAGAHWHVGRGGGAGGAPRLEAGEV